MEMPENPYKIILDLLQACWLPKFFMQQRCNPNIIQFFPQRPHVANGAMGQRGQQDCKQPTPKYQ